MKIKEISFTLSKTINLGNYESFKAEVGMVAEIDLMEDKSIDEQYLELSLAVREKLNDEIDNAL